MGLPADAADDELEAKMARAVKKAEHECSVSGEVASHALLAANTIPVDVQKLVEQLRSGQKEQAARALAHFARRSADNQVAITMAGGIAPLVAMVGSGTDGQKEQAAQTLWCVAANLSDNKSAIVRSGGIAPLVVLARDGTRAQKENAVGALFCLADSVKHKAAIVKAGGIAPLVALARSASGTNRQKELAAGVLFNLADKKENVAMMKEMGYGKKSAFGWKVPKP